MLKMNFKRDFGCDTRKAYVLLRVNHGMLQPSTRRLILKFGFAVGWAIHGYTPRAQTNERTLLNNVVWRWYVEVTFERLVVCCELRSVEL